MKSIIPNDEKGKCYLCGREGYTEVHHIFGGSVRKTADKLGLTVNLCQACHHCLHGKYGSEMKQHLHKIGQEEYENQIGTREQFIGDFIRSYL